MVEREKSMKKIRSVDISDRFFRVFNVIIMILFCLTALYPFWNLVTVSISAESVNFSQFHLIPPEISFSNYVKVFQNSDIHMGFIITIVRTVLGTFLSLIVTIGCAYALSKKHFPHRGFWTGFIVFTMFFNGGMIPTYLVVRGVGITNTIWSLILPRLIDTFALLIMRNYFMTLPEGLEESAHIDGASTFQILFKIVIPVSKPIIATVVLWVAVWHWNSWFDSLIYITDANKQVLQVILRQIVLEGTSKMTDMAFQDDGEMINPQTLKAATTMVATIPILLIYPFLQKHFVKGVMVGSLKG